MSVEGSHTFKRPIYAGNAIITVEADAGSHRGRHHPHRLLAGSGQRRQQRAGRSTSPSTPRCPRTPASSNCSRASSDRPDLQSASKVVSGGRGVGSKENFDIIYKFADKIGAAVGASRAAVDAGYVPSDLQVGQTGKIIAPELYMAIGISGAIQHLTGIKDAGTIVAINKDGEAPIFEIADIGLVGDLFKLIPGTGTGVGLIAICMAAAEAAVIVSFPRRKFQCDNPEPTRQLVLVGEVCCKACLSKCSGEFNFRRYWHGEDRHIPAWIQSLSLHGNITPEAPRVSSANDEVRMMELAF